MVDKHRSSREQLKLHMLEEGRLERGSLELEQEHIPVEGAMNMEVDKLQEAAKFQPEEC